MTTSPEANAVAFFSFKRTDGFEVSLTLRGDSGTEVLVSIEKAITAVKNDGATPVVRGQFQKKEKVINYVEGRKCPTCGKRLIRETLKDGRQIIKCETNKYDFATKTVIGCKFTEWWNR